MADKTMVLTYETLFEMLTREKNREELQKLDSNFFEGLVAYLREKRAITENKGSLTNYTEQDKSRAEKELQNIIKIIKELYERREKKIMFMALNKSRTGSNLIDSSALVGEELLFFNTLVENMNKYRDRILNSILNDKLGKQEKQNTKLVRFLHDVPKFVGRELEIYGPFKEEDVANLPIDIATILLEKGRAEEINEG